MPSSACLLQRLKAQSRFLVFIISNKPYKFSLSEYTVWYTVYSLCGTQYEKERSYQRKIGGNEARAAARYFDTGSSERAEAGAVRLFAA